MKDRPKLPDGTPVYDHTGIESEFRGPLDAGVHLEEIERFLGEFLGEQAGVFHEIISDKVHLDVLIFPPNELKENWTFVTSGMSDLPMNVPDDLGPREDFERAELVFTLPVTWFTAGSDGMISEDQLAQPDKYWPIGLLKFIARLPHEYDSWVWRTHTFVADGDPPEPYSTNTRMSGSILFSPLSWPDDKRVLETASGTKINFFCIIPLHPDEMMLKLNKGVDALVDGLGAAGVTDVLDAGRPSTVKKKRFFGFLGR